MVRYVSFLEGKLFSRDCEIPLWPSLLKILYLTHHLYQSKNILEFASGFPIFHRFSVFVGQRSEENTNHEMLRAAEEEYQLNLVRGTQTTSEVFHVFRWITRTWLTQTSSVNGQWWIDIWWNSENLKLCLARGRSCNDNKNPKVNQHLTIKWETLTEILQILPWLYKHQQSKVTANELPLMGCFQTHVM